MNCRNTIPHVVSGWSRLREEWDTPSSCTQNSKCEKITLKLCKRPVVAVAMAVYAVATPIVATFDFIYTALSNKRKGGNNYSASAAETTPLLTKDVPKPQIPKKCIYPHQYEVAELPPLTLDEQGWTELMNIKDEVISGFLEIGQEQGWEDGGFSRNGALFARVMFKKFIFENQSKLSEQFDLLRKVDCALYRDLSANSRAYYDNGKIGWKEHTISRVIGHLTSSPRVNGPFFEVIINSQRYSEDEELTYPFAVYILPDKNYADQRSEILKSSSYHDAQIAKKAYYFNDLFTPRKYLNFDEKILDPYTKQFTLGLDFLSNRQFEAQRSGNCWIKQPMLCILVCLYIELLTHRQDLSDEQCWKQAVIFYKKWEQYTVREIKKMAVSGGVSMDLLKIVKAKLEKNENP